MRTPRSAAARQVRASVAASTAGKPPAPVALGTTSSIASSSPSFQTPKLSPRSAFRSTVTEASLGRCPRGPTVLGNEFAQRAAYGPFVDLQLGPVREVRNRAEAQDGHGFRAVRHGQQR